MRDTSGIIWRRGYKPVSLLWDFNEDGSPFTLSICPHDRRVKSRMILFELGRRAREFIEGQEIPPAGWRKMGRSICGLPYCGVELNRGEKFCPGHVYLISRVEKKCKKFAEESRALFARVTAGMKIAAS